MNSRSATPHQAGPTIRRPATARAATAALRQLVTLIYKLWTATTRRSGHAAPQTQPTSETSPAGPDCQEIAFPDERSAFVQGLRDLADFIETHPDLPLPDPSSTVSPYLGSSVPATDEHRRAEVDRIASILGVTASETGHHHYIAVRHFGPIAYKAVAINAEEMERYTALMSYNNAVEPADPDVPR